MGTKDTIGAFIQVIIFLPFIIFLIYLFSKYGGEKLQSLQNGRYMKILDRMPLSKDNAILITKIGEKGYLISSAQGRVEILRELDENEIKKIEEDKNLNTNPNFKEVITKLKFKKEDK
ncbi:flagellar biosynthetic protein FliO [Clostridium brassicae]|uniref:Flagellar protein n=1 Tax=Clostridium brassicae TaxID=2999072 RepID=A0ABT4DES9_9CLOT|nr:flagellar biosynthetic protein FliO [Clostridium brassicae]MCY6959611.1 flagellar biosynthetic protein FliO [Clostridium brassicae]